MALAPRVVLVSRETELMSLSRNYGTTSNAAFFNKSRGSEAVTKMSQTSSAIYTSAIEQVAKAIPKEWRQARVTRDDLDRFSFEDGDIIAAVGQDGLVANVAKYLTGQIVIGFNDNPHRNPGVLVKYNPTQAEKLFNFAHLDPSLAKKKARTMVQATLDDGQTIVGLNEIFIGRKTHQSAKYEINVNGTSELQSSSGVIISTGTGCTGWAASICLERGIQAKLEPSERRLMFLVREPWPGSHEYGTSITNGYITDRDKFFIRSLIDDEACIFADGIEVDHLDFSIGRVASIACSEEMFNLL